MKRSGRKSVLLDANVLLLQVIGSCDRGWIERFGRTSEVFGPDDFDLLQLYLHGADALVATPSVLTEVSNLCRGVSGSSRARARAALAQVISICDERHVPSRDSAVHPAFARLGLTDVGIVLLARSGIQVMTIDLELYVELARQELDVLNFNHLR